MSPDAHTAIRQQILDLQRMTSIISADVHFHCWKENELTTRADEVCAAAQRLAWALDRIERTEIESEVDYNLRGAA
jgi:hypothetical protein